MTNEYLRCLTKIPFKPHLSLQFRIAYDVYLDILYGVDDLVNAALGRNSPQWRMRNACAPCLYTVEGEEMLRPALLATMDGNQSLKLIDDTYRSGTVRSDPRTARTDMWLSPEEVDRWKDEVHSHEVSAWHINICMIRDRPVRNLRCRLLLLSHQRRHLV